jgi:hypothetical protein
MNGGQNKAFLYRPVLFHDGVEITVGYFYSDSGGH